MILSERKKFMNILRFVSKRTAIRIISFLIAAAVISTVSIILLDCEKEKYRQQVKYSYELALDELAESLNSINIALEKGAYATSANTLSSVSTQLTKAAGTAKSALSALPFSGSELATVNKLLSQVGDYTAVLARSAYSSKTIDAKDSENLLKLSDIAGTLHSAVTDIINGSAQPGESMIGATADKLGEIGAALLNSDEAITDYPTLIYDGPFSDHMLEGEAKLLKNQQKITREGARQVAALYLGISADRIEDDGDEEGEMAAYGFKTGDTSIAITKRGGFCSYFRKDRTVGSENKNYDEAKNIALSYLEKLNLGEFEESYFITDEGLCVINFACKQDSVICYPDLVKVGVALDTGEILLFEGRSYIMNHHQRDLSEIEYSVEEARANVSPTLTIKSENIAIIPSDGNEERLCYEFVCKNENDEDILVYVNSATNEEENILIITHVDGGILAK